MLESIAAHVVVISYRTMTGVRDTEDIIITNSPSEWDAVLQAGLMAERLNLHKPKFVKVTKVVMPAVAEVTENQEK